MPHQRLLARLAPVPRDGARAHGRQHVSTWAFTSSCTSILITPARASTQAPCAAAGTPPCPDSVPPTPLEQRPWRRHPVRIQDQHCCAASGVLEVPGDLAGALVGPGGSDRAVRNGDGKTLPSGMASSWRRRAGPGPAFQACRIGPDAFAAPGASMASNCVRRRGIPARHAAMARRRASRSCAAGPRLRCRARRARRGCVQRGVGPRELRLRLPITRLASDRR